MDIFLSFLGLCVIVSFPILLGVWAWTLIAASPRFSQFVKLFAIGFIFSLLQDIVSEKVANLFMTFSFVWLLIYFVGHFFRFQKMKRKLGEIVLKVSGEPGWQNAIIMIFFLGLALLSIFLNQDIIRSTNELEKMALVSGVALCMFLGFLPFLLVNGLEIREKGIAFGCVAVEREAVDSLRWDLLNPNSLVISYTLSAYKKTEAQIYIKKSHFEKIDAFLSKNA